MSNAAASSLGRPYASPHAVAVGGREGALIETVGPERYMYEKSLCGVFLDIGRLCARKSRVAVGPIVLEFHE